MIIMFIFIDQKFKIKIVKQFKRISFKYGDFQFNYQLLRVQNLQIFNFSSYSFIHLFIFLQQSESEAKMIEQNNIINLQQNELINGQVIDIMMNQPNIQNEQIDQNNNARQNQLAQPQPQIKPLQQYTIRDIFQINQARRQILKNLPTNQFVQQNQFKYLLQSNYRTLRIAHHFRDSIENEEVRKRVIRIFQIKYKVKRIVSLSMFTFLWWRHYLRLIPFLQSKIWHLITPLGIVGVSMLISKIIQMMTRDLRQSMKEWLAQAVKKYLCETGVIQQAKIIKQKLGYQMLFRYQFSRTSNMLLTRRWPDRAEYVFQTNF